MKIDRPTAVRELVKAGHERLPGRERLRIPVPGSTVEVVPRTDPPASHVHPAGWHWYCSRDLAGLEV